MKKITSSRGKTAAYFILLITLHFMLMKGKKKLFKLCRTNGNCNDRVVDIKYNTKKKMQENEEKVEWMTVR